jgi:ubiquitin-protein ligase
VDCCIQHSDRSAKSAKFARRAKQVSFMRTRERLLLTGNSASPLNGEAAELWDKDPVEFKRKVLGRHQDVDDE